MRSIIEFVHIMGSSFDSEVQAAQMDFSNILVTTHFLANAHDERHDGPQLP